jgi:hypothetical protein
MGYALGSSCSAGKPTEEGNLYARAVMEWFGYGLTGEVVVINPDGLTVPGWILVDPVQQARAIANPDGFQQDLNAAVRSVTWSATKQLYR